MTEKNTMVDLETGEKMEVALNEQVEIIIDTPEYDVAIIDGKKVKRAKYEEYSSVKAETPEEKVRLFNLINGSDDSVITLKTVPLKTKIKIMGVIFTPYETIDDETNEFKRNVNTLLVADDGKYYATSSKNVYFTLRNAFKVFGKPGDTNYMPITIEIGKEKSTNNRDMIAIKLV